MTYKGKYTNIEQTMTLINYDNKYIFLDLFYNYQEWRAMTIMNDDNKFVTYGIYFPIEHIFYNGNSKLA